MCNGSTADGLLEGVSQAEVQARFAELDLGLVTGVSVEPEWVARIDVEDIGLVDLVCDRAARAPHLPCRPEP